MKLSVVERQILYNQYEILIATCSDVNMIKMYKQQQTILEFGYSLDYHEVINVSEIEASLDVMQTVRDILEMHRHLYKSYNELTKKEKEQVDFKDIEFIGFDGNNEAGHCCYAQFLLDDLMLYKELAIKDCDAHFPSLERYMEKHAVYRNLRGIGDYRSLTLDELRQIVSA